MPNYKSDNLTFLTIAEMTSMLVDSTDQEGLLFAVKTGATTFKMVMWMKNSSATVDNETVYPANGPGRWHVMPVTEISSGKEEVVTIVGDVIPSSISGDTDLIALKKTDGTKELRAKFDGVFESLLGTSGGGSGANVSYYSLNTSLGQEEMFTNIQPPEDRNSFAFAVIDVWTPSYTGEQHFYYLYCWAPRIPALGGEYYSGYILINTQAAISDFSTTDFSFNKGVKFGEIRHRDMLNGIGPQDYDNYINWFVWDGGKWDALVTKSNTINQYSYVRTKCFVDSAGLVIGGEVLAIGDIPDLPTSKITSGTFNLSRIPTGTTSNTVALGDHNHVFSNLTGISLLSPVSGQVLGFNGTNWTNVASAGGSGSVTLTGDVTGTGTGSLATALANIGTAGTYTKVTTDAKGRVLSGASLLATDIPSLDTGKITTGIFDVARIPNLSTSKITSGVFDISYIPTGTTSTTVALGNHNHAFSSLSGISITSPTNGQILSYDNATSEWKNTTLPTGTGAVNSVDGAFGDVILANTYQAKSNELTAFAGLPDTVGFIKKTADGAYTIENITGGSGGVTSVDGLTGVVVLSSNYLALTGGTVSGITTFSSAAPSTSTTTGAVKITSGGLGVIGSGYFGGDLSHNGFFKKNGVGSIGWTAMSGTADLATNLDTSTVTLLQLAQRLKGIQDALASLGILDATGNDPYFANVALLLRGDGVDGSTNIVDSSSSPKPLTVTGSTRISTTESKYNGSSLYFDGNGDCLSTPLSGVDVRNKDFTIEGFIYPLSFSVDGLIFSTYNNPFQSATLITGVNTTGKIYLNANGTEKTHTTSLGLNTWSHFSFCFVLSSSTLYISVNGVVQSFSVPGFNISTPSTNAFIGGSPGDNNIGNRWLNAYLDSYRITLNIARYTSDFNPLVDSYLS